MLSPWRTVGTLLLAFVLIAASPARLEAQPPESGDDGAAPGAATTVRSGLARETRALDDSIDQYAESREAERVALSELVALNTLLDSTLLDPNTQPAELIDLETEIAQTRDLACGTSLATASARQAMYERMLRLQNTIDALERRAIDLLDVGTELAGTWRIEGEERANGLMSLAQSGNRLTGTFRLSNGARGSVSGTVSADQVTLRLIEATSRAIVDVEGSIVSRGEIPFDDEGPPEMSGRWQAMELADGRPSSGDWRATWLSLEQALEAPP